MIALLKNLLSSLRLKRPIALGLLVLGVSGWLLAAQAPKELTRLSKAQTLPVPDLSSVPDLAHKKSFAEPRAKLSENVSSPEATSSPSNDISDPSFSPPLVPPSSVGEENQNRASRFRDEEDALLAFNASTLGTGSVQQAIDSLGNFAELYQGASGGVGPRGKANVFELPLAEVDERYCVTLENIPAAGLLSLKVSAGALPKGVQLLSAARQLCGTPKNKGIFLFSLDAAYGVNDVRPFPFRLVVRESTGNDKDDSALTITSIQLEVGALGTPYAAQLQALGGKRPYNWNVAGLPKGLEVDQGSGVIGGTPEEEGTFGLLVSLSDQAGTKREAQFELIIRNSPIFITTNALESGVLNTFYQSQLTAQGGTPPYRWELVTGKLPMGLEFDAGGVIRGEPAEVFSGLLRIRVLDKDAKSDAADLMLSIRASDLRILTRALPEAFTGSSYTAALEAEGGKTPYRWAVQQGALPEGLSLDPSGRVFGITSTEQEASVVFRVTDANNATADQALLLRTVNEESPEETPEPTPLPTATPLAPTPTPSSTPEPTVSIPDALPEIGGFKATSSDGKIGLIWTLPADSRFVRALIVRSEIHFPESTEDGVPIYQGTATSFADDGLVNGKTYFYSAFAFYGEAGYSLSETARATIGPHDVSVFGKPDVFIDEVVQFTPLDPAGCFNCTKLPGIILGAPKGAGENSGSSDVVSFNARANDDGGASAPYGGSMTLKFNDNIVVDGPGTDFIIFENAFRLQGTDLYWVEPATVEVSADGIRFYRFPFDFVPHYDSQGVLNLQNPFCYAQGFAGVKPVYSNNNLPDPTNAPLAGGDAFDLSALPGTPLTWIQYIRITSTGDGWLRDIDGEYVRHMNGTPTFAASGKGNSGFDLDAIAAVHY